MAMRFAYSTTALEDCDSDRTRPWRSIEYESILNPQNHCVLNRKWSTIGPHWRPFFDWQAR
jgi:hypothetical protein